MQKHSIGGVVIFALVGALLIVSWPQAIAAQSVTITPLPGPVATATAAAAQLADAQAKRQQANAMDAEAQRLRQESDATAAAAQQAVSDSRAALVAQQFGAAAEAIGRAESDIASLRDNGAQRDSIITRQADIIDGLTAANAQQASELQQVRGELAQMKTINEALRANNETIAKQVTAGGKTDGVIQISLGFFALLIIALLIGFVAWKWQKSNNTSSGDDTVTIEGEVVEHSEEIP